MGRMNKFIFLTVISFLTFSASAQVKWHTIEEALEINKDAKKKIFMDIYTEWCSWCKKMDKATFQDPQIAAYLNENYIAVRLDAEQKEDIQVRKKTYKYVKNGFRGYNEFAIEILRGRMSFPTVVFFDEKLNIIQSLPGFQDKDRFSMIMKYFAEDHYTQVPWSRFMREQNAVKLAIDRN